MSKPPHIIQPPLPIFWVIGWLSLGFGALMLMLGYYLIQEQVSRIGGLILVSLGGIGFGIGGRVLLSCWNGLRKSRKKS